MRIYNLFLILIITAGCSKDESYTMTNIKIEKEFPIYENKRISGGLSESQVYPFNLNAVAFAIKKIPSNSKITLQPIFSVITNDL